MLRQTRFGARSLFLMPSTRDVHGTRKSRAAFVEDWQPSRATGLSVRAEAARSEGGAGEQDGTGIAGAALTGLHQACIKASKRRGRMCGAKQVCDFARAVVAGSCKRG